MAGREEGLIWCQGDVSIHRFYREAVGVHVEAHLHSWLAVIVWGETFARLRLKQGFRAIRFGFQAGAVERRAAYAVASVHLRGGVGEGRRDW